jgi:hypothetical protein
MEEVRTYVRSGYRDAGRGGQDIGEVRIQGRRHRRRDILEFRI